MKLIFTTTTGWSMQEGFGCASLGLAGISDNATATVNQYPEDLQGILLTGNYSNILTAAEKVTDRVYVAIVLFGNAGGENVFLHKLQQLVNCPMVGGGAAIDPQTGRKALITGRGEAAVFLIIDDRYAYETSTECIHSTILENCRLELADARTIRSINGMDAAAYLSAKKNALGLQENDFEHLTLSDRNHVNAHLSCVDGVIKSGRDLEEEMLLRYVAQADVYNVMHKFYDDPRAIVFGCAGLAGMLEKPLQTKSLGLFLFGEVCTTNGVAEFGNLMLSKLRIIRK